MRYKFLCEDHVLMVRADLRVSLRGQQHPKRERAISSSVSTFLCELGSSSKPTNKHPTELRLDTDTITSQTIYLSSSITLYNGSLRPKYQKLFTRSSIFTLLTFILLSVGFSFHCQVEHFICSVSYTFAANSCTAVKILQSVSSQLTDFLALDLRTAVRLKELQLLILNTNIRLF
jgi:hypothetical protein